MGKCICGKVPCDDVEHTRLEQAAEECECAMCGEVMNWRGDCGPEPGDVCDSCKAEKLDAANARIAAMEAILREALDVIGDGDNGPGPAYEDLYLRMESVLADRIEGES